MPTGKVYLIGAGPGDPGLITLRGVELLARADAVLYDYLVNPAILAHCQPGAIKISLGQHGTGRVMSQDDVNDRVADLVQIYPTVVRLKSGDPMVFARAGEELDFLAQRGIEFEIVPGVTAALAAAAYAGVPVTHRDAASAVAFVTGQEDAAKSDSSLDYSSLARFPGTLVFYMGVTTADLWSSALISAGKPAQTPVAIVRRVSTPTQQRIDTTLGEVASVVERQRLRPPVVFIVGDAAAHGAAWSWFEKRPLCGQTVLVTRPLEQADDLARPLAELGANVLFQPAIEIRPTADSSPLDGVISRLGDFAWLVFSSANGVRYFFDRLKSLGRDVRALGHVQIAAIGPGTAAELAKHHLRADIIPDEFRAESLAAALTRRVDAAVNPGVASPSPVNPGVHAKSSVTAGIHPGYSVNRGVHAGSPVNPRVHAGSPAGQRFLLIRASRGREVLAEELTAAGAIVEQAIAYESLDVAEPDPNITAKMSSGQIHWTTVTSSAIARSLVNLFGDSLHKTKLVTISPITSATLHELGFEPAAEAKEYTMDGIVAAIKSWIQE